MKLLYQLWAAYIWFLLIEKNKTPNLLGLLFLGLYYSQQIHFLTPRCITVYSLQHNQRPLKVWVGSYYWFHITLKINLRSLKGQLGLLWSGPSISPNSSPTKSPYDPAHHLHTHTVPWTSQTCFCLRTFAFAVPLPKILSPHTFTWFATSFLLGSNSNVAFSERLSWLLYLKQSFCVSSRFLSILP